MAEHQAGVDHRSKLDAAATALAMFIRDVCPDAQLEISFARYEDEDAHIRISLPARLSVEERETLANRVAERSIDLRIAEGVLILVGIEDTGTDRDPLGDDVRI